MATAAKKTATQRATTATRRTISTTSLDDSGDIVEKTSGDKIALAQPQAAQEQVTVVVPTQYTLTRDDGSVTTFLPGIQEMGLDDASHWFSRNMGVKVYSPSTH